ncbi:hypothetical protein OZ411_34480 [Bradyrhizobium sp. Arg237L]|uniref:hypothetical protein n=1 Tax=Bradyrhizobium sp. Arg237L TaxID=3003352 RepID=UPI00249F8F36|nr:hypothetical protein [Bradyrhizobium sp. Arg237L]MDI4237924.1 hypothetical protein [Bradyrhizobium sp. Arg237L]
MCRSIFLADATDVVVEKVCFVERPSWIGGRHGDGMTNDILFTPVKVIEVKRGQVEIGQAFMSEWDCEMTIEILPIRTRPINAVIECILSRSAELYPAASTISEGAWRFYVMRA